MTDERAELVRLVVSTRWVASRVTTGRGSPDRAKMLARIRVAVGQGDAANLSPLEDLSILLALLDDLADS